MARDAAKGAEGQRCRGQKRVKLIATSVKWKNHGHRRPCWQSTSLQVEVRPRKVVHMPTRIGTGRSLPKRKSARGGASITSWDKLFS